MPRIQMRRIRKIAAVILALLVIAAWFFLPSSDLNFPYFYCLGCFFLIAALVIYPIQPRPTSPQTKEALKEKR